MADSGRERLERSEELRAITERLWQANSRGDVDAVVMRKSRVRGVTMFGPYAGEFIGDPDQFLRYIRLLFEDSPGGFPQLGQAEIEAWSEGTVGWSISRLPIDHSGVPMNSG